MTTRAWIDCRHRWDERTKRGQTWFELWGNTGSLATVFQRRGLWFYRLTGWDGAYGVSGADDGKAAVERALNIRRAS